MILLDINLVLSFRLPGLPAGCQGRVSICMPPNTHLEQGLEYGAVSSEVTKAPLEQHQQTEFTACIISSVC
jgi:hypothetical protein